MANGRTPGFPAPWIGGMIRPVHEDKMPEQGDSRRCPYCSARLIETIATLPVVRGNAKGLGARFRTMTLAGCRVCVRKKLVMESVRSGLEGWGSLGSALANPVLITYGLARACIVRRDPERVQRLLEAAGIAEPPVRPVRIAYGLAAALICADGTVDAREIDIARAIGKQVFAEFDDSEFDAVIATSRNLPGPADLARVLGSLVEPGTKEAVYRFLVAIAAADSAVVAEEQAMLKAVAENLGLVEAGAGLDRSA